MSIIKNSNPASSKASSFGQDAQAKATAKGKGKIRNGGSQRSTKFNNSPTTHSLDKTPVSIPTPNLTQKNGSPGNRQSGGHR